MSEPVLAAAQRWVLRAAVLVLPLVYSPFTYDSYVLPKLALARGVLVVLLALLVGRFVIARQVVIRRTALDLAWLVFLTSAAISTVFAVSVNVAVFGTYGRYDGLLTLLLYAALFWVSVQTIQSRAEARTVMRFLLAGAYAVAAIAIAQSLRDGLAPAYGTLGNPNVLGAYLAMVLPLALGEVLTADSRTARVIAANVVVVVGLALLMSLSRSAWVAAWIACAVAVAAGRGPALRLAVYAASWVVVLLLVIGVVAMVGGSPLLDRLGTRASALGDPGPSRIGIWKDSLCMVESRPVAGFGPDNVGLVFTDFQSGDWGRAAGGIRQPIDKAHAEVLQIAATQGAIGVAAYVFIVVVFVRVFWRGRRTDFALPVFAGWLAYQLTIQLNFTALSAALPFWFFAAAAIVTWGGAEEVVTARASRAAGAVVVPVGLVLLVAGVGLPLAADANLKTAVEDDFGSRPDLAAPFAATAASLAPQEPVYSTEVANLAFERGDWSGARRAYQNAARLGTFNALVFRNLALADQKLGLNGEGKASAQRAVALDPYDPANQALLAQFG